MGLRCPKLKLDVRSGHLVSIILNFCHTWLILEFQLIQNSGKSQLASWAIKWQYYQEYQSYKSDSQPAIYNSIPSSIYGKG